MREREREREKVFKIEKLNSWRFSSEGPRPTEAVAKRYPSTLISVFLNGFRYFSYQIATNLSSRGWVDPVPDPRLP